MKNLFILLIAILLPLTTFAQDKMLGEINKQIKDNPQNITKQELKSKLVNEWGEKELKFLELNNGTLIPMTVEKSNKLLKVQDTQDTEWWVHVVIIVGAVLIVLLILGFLFWITWEGPFK